MENEAAHRERILDLAEKLRVVTNDHVTKHKLQPFETATATFWFLGWTVEWLMGLTDQGDSAEHNRLKVQEHILTIFELTKAPSETKVN